MIGGRPKKRRRRERAGQNNKWLTNRKCKIYTTYQVNTQSGSAGSTCEVFLSVRERGSLRSEMHDIIGGESETIISPQWWRSIYAKIFFRVNPAFRQRFRRTDCTTNELHE